MQRRLICFCIVYAHVATGVSKTSCDAPAVYNKQPANVTCHFDDDASKMKNDVFVHLTNTTGYHEVLVCTWSTDNQHKCNAGPGYSVVGNITRKLVLGIASAAEEFVGQYVCQMMPSEPEDLVSCNFTLKETTQETDQEENSSSIKEKGTAQEVETGKNSTGENDNINVGAVVGGVLGGIAGLCVIIGVAVVIYRRVRRKSEPESNDGPAGFRSIANEGGNSGEPVPGNAETDEGQRLALLPQHSPPPTISSWTNPIRLMIIGKTGNGKSCLANALLGKERFIAQSGIGSVSTECDYDTVETHKNVFRVIDTPGLYDTKSAEEDVYCEVARSVFLASPGPHVILMVFRCDVRFTEEEYKVYKTLKTLFGEEMCEYMIVIFNAIDAFSMNDTSDLTRMQDGMEKNLKKNAPASLKTVLQEVNNRYFGMTSNAPADVKKELVDKLFVKIMELVEHNGRIYYNKSLFKGIAQSLDEEVRKRLKQDPRKTEEIAVKEIRKEILQAKEEPGYFSTAVQAVRTYLSDVQAGPYKLCSVM